MPCTGNQGVMVWFPRGSRVTRPAVCFFCRRSTRASTRAGVWGYAAGDIAMFSLSRNFNINCRLRCGSGCTERYTVKRCFGGPVTRLVSEEGRRGQLLVRPAQWGASSGAGAARAVPRFPWHRVWEIFLAWRPSAAPPSRCPDGVSSLPFLCFGERAQQVARGPGGCKAGHRGGGPGSPSPQHPACLPVAPRPSDTSFGGLLVVLF